MVYRYKASFCSFVVAVALILGLADARLAAQGAAVILGTVSDSSGGVIAEARVQVTNTGTGATQVITSDDQGRYRAPALPLGQYDVQAEKSGFQVTIHRGITLDAGANLVVDLQLTVGQVAQSVVVEGAISQVETTSAALSTLVEPTQMRDLPLNGRNYQELIKLAPGVTVSLAATRNAFMGFGEYLSISGSRVTGQAILLDGTNIQNYGERGGGAGVLGTTLGVDGISEFQLLSNTYGAQYGGNGSVMNSVTRSGTNSLHGSLYEFMRNNALDASRYFDTKKFPFRKNQFGGTIGGPIKKDKMFFFGNYEGLRQATGIENRVIVPNALAHQGIIPTQASLVPGVCTTAGQPAGLMNCGPGSPNAAKFAVIKPYLDLFPLNDAQLQAMVVPEVAAYGRVAMNPTLTDLLNGTAQTYVDATTRGHENYFLGRYDWTVSDKDSLFARYVYDDGVLNDFGSTTWPLYPAFDESKNQYLTIGEKHVFSDHIVNSAQVAATRSYLLNYPIGGNTSSLLNFEGDLFTPFGLPPKDGTISPGSAISGLGPAAPQPIRYTQDKISLTEDLLWDKGSHSLRFGGTVIREQTNGLHSIFSGGSWTFSNLASFLQDIPNRFQGPCNYYNGKMPGCVFSDGTPLAFPSTRHDPRDTQFAFYVQDDWKLRPTLTVNIGLRYSPATNPYDSLNQSYQLLPVPFGQTGPLPPGVSSAPATAFTKIKTFSLVNTSLHNIDPRIGVAWDPFPDHKTAIRAGYGIFHSVLQVRDYSYGAFTSYPWSNITQTAGLGTFPLAFQTPVSGATNVQYGWNPYNTTPYLQQWNLSVQREVMRNTILTVAYVGSHGVHLLKHNDENPPLASGAPGAINLKSGTTLWPNYPSQQFVCTVGSCSFSGPNSGNVTCNTASGCTLAAANGQAFVNPATGQMTYAHIEQTGATSFSVQGNTRMNPNFSYINGDQSNAYSLYDALQLGVVRRMTNNLSAQVSYTYSSCTDNSSGSNGYDGANPAPNPYNIEGDRGPCNFMIRHVLTTNALYMLPFKGNRLISGWQVGGVAYFRTGGPTNPTSWAMGPEITQVSNTERPNYVPNAPGCNSKPVNDNMFQAGSVFPVYFNSACFAVPALGEEGNVGRNSFFGPRSSVFNFTIQKNTTIKEQYNVQFRAEFFNAFNHANFSQPAATFQQGLTNSAASVVTGTPTSTFGQITDTGDPRQIQFGIKFVF